jgi:membrane protease YdiL (CAAX protease family)
MIMSQHRERSRLALPISLYQELIAPLSGADPHLRVTARLIALLLFLRIPWLYLALPFSRFRPLSGFGSSVYVTGTASILAYLIWHERDHLAAYHVDRVVIVLFLLGKPLELAFMVMGWRSSLGPAVLPLYTVYLLAPIWLLWKLRGRWRRLPGPPAGVLRWMGVALGLGLLFGFMGRYLIWIQAGAAFPLLPRPLSIELLIQTVLYQAASAGLSEEPLFRGFLWGYLHKLGWPVKRVLIFQASLFALAHLDALLIGYWITTFLALVIGLVLGWLVYRSRSITTTITAHGLINGIGTLMH